MVPTGVRSLEALIRLAPTDDARVRSRASSSRPKAAGVVLARVSDPAAVVAPLFAAVWRTSPQRPVRVAAGDAPLVVRATTRRPMPRGGMDVAPATLAFEARIDVPRRRSDARAGELLERARSKRTTATKGARRADAPSEKVVLYALVPAQGSLTITPPASARSTCQPRGARSEQRAAAAYAGPRAGRGVSGDRSFYGHRRSGRVRARRPSNVAAFDANARALVRIAPRLVARVAPC